MKHAVLVLGDYQQSIVVVRSLGRQHRVVVGRLARPAFSSFSRYAHGAWQHPDPAGNEAFVGAIRALLARRPDITHVFPVGESEIAALVPAEGTLPPGVQLVMAPSAVVTTCFDKPRSYQLAAELDIPIARTTVVHNATELLRFADSAGPPLVLKCPDSTRLLHGRKAEVCPTREAFERWNANALPADYPLIVQRWAPGARHNCHFASADGVLTAYFEQRVLRTDEADGTGFGVEGISVAPSPLLRRHCQALARRLGYHGVGCAQFLVDDRSGAHVFLELNPRLDSTCELPYRCGIDLPGLAVNPRAGAPPRYPVGRRFHWLLGDARGIRLQLKRGDLTRRGSRAALRQLANSCWRAHYQLTWAWTDPLPTFYLYSQALLAGSRTYMNRAGLSATHP